MKMQILLWGLKIIKKNYADKIRLEYFFRGKKQTFDRYKENFKFFWHTNLKKSIKRN